MHGLTYSPEKITLPVAYIQAKYDKLVPAVKLKEFEDNFKTLTMNSLDGPHFILQAKPKETAELIMGLLEILTSLNPSRSRT